ncbi:MAG TPA: porin family protein [Candidatus Krumholzibacteria bacterium]
MRQVTAIACVLVLMATAGNAGAVGWHLGIKGGVNMADLAGDDGPSDTSFRNGFIGGGFADYLLNDRFGVRAEVLYVQKGAEGSFVVPGQDHAHDSIVKLDYVEIPLLFTGRFPAGEKFAFGLFAGPTLSFNTTAEVEIPSHNETEALDAVKSFELGAAFGGGIEYILPSFSLLADARYGLGTASVIEDIAGQTVDVKNRGLGIMAGVAVPIGR